MIVVRKLTLVRCLTRGVIPVLAAFVAVQTPVLAADAQHAPGLLEQLGGMSSGGVPVAVRLLIFITIFSIVPSIVLLTTCFPRILIVLSFLRRALGTQDLPPNMVVIGLAFVLTAMIMTPVWKEVHAIAYQPLVKGEITDVGEALVLAEKPIKRFMRNQTSDSDIQLMLELAQTHRAPKGSEQSASPPTMMPADLEDPDLSIVLPAFVLSELRTAFQMGFLLYLPFLMIDLMVSAVLLSMGMFMLPPVLISLPIKVLVFVLVDGWNVVVEQLVNSFY